MPLFRPATRRHKFGAKPTRIDGVYFHSTKEANRWCDLRLMERAREIRDLERQPVFELHSPAPNGELVKVGKYTADFRYVLVATGATVIEDVKAKDRRGRTGSRLTRTDSYQLRKRMAEAEFGIRISEV